MYRQRHFFWIVSCPSDAGNELPAPPIIYFIVLQKYFENFLNLYQKMAFPLDSPAQHLNLIRLPMLKLCFWGKSRILSAF